MGAALPLRGDFDAAGLRGVVKRRGAKPSPSGACDEPSRDGAAQHPEQLRLEAPDQRAKPCIGLKILDVRHPVEAGNIENQRESSARRSTLGPGSQIFLIADQGSGSALGEANEAVFGALGLSSEEIAELARNGSAPPRQASAVAAMVVLSRVESAAGGTEG